MISAQLMVIAFSAAALGLALILERRRRRREERRLRRMTRRVWQMMAEETELSADVCNKIEQQLAA